MKASSLPLSKGLGDAEDGHSPLLDQTPKGSVLSPTCKKVAAVLAGASILIASAVFCWLLVFSTSAAPGARAGVHCASEYLNSESGNFQKWVLTERCEGFVTTYVTGGRYALDFGNAVALAKMYYASQELAGDGLDVIVLDIDETALSNMPYYRFHRYGAEKFDPVKWDVWVRESAAIAPQPMLEFYRDLQAMGYKMTFLTGRKDSQRNATEANLLSVGYTNWLELHMRLPDEKEHSALEYKSARRVALEEKGYRVRGSVGDQWSDILGPSVGNRTFKLPNPMYYII
eukprot:TRINITY_DN19881_c0_g2_i1.p1 TRINITY_DN19881_c0_g2~~TRINITY_DN19881_c0_g2_i1.p1  ORF type:complete len:287 (-),score=42.18 TRINITY_DN19881_c0_g2_i1:192-1052(-)